MYVRMLLLNRNFALIFGVLSGFFVPRGAAWAEPLILPVLGVVMTVAVAGMEIASMRSLKNVLKHACTGIVMNYVVLSGTILLLNHYLINDSSFRSGFILIATVPPAVAVIPFSFLLRGDGSFSLIGTIGSYLGALVIMPVLALLFFGASIMKPSNLMIVVFELILLPLVVGHFLHRAGIDSRFGYLKGPVTNWGFALITYTVVGLNRDLFLSEPLSLIPSMIVIIASTFLLGWLVQAISRKIPGTSDNTVVSLILLGTLKNYGIAGGLALTLFDEKTAAPSTLSAVFMILYIMWLEWKLHSSHRNRRTDRGK